MEKTSLVRSIVLTFLFQTIGCDYHAPQGSVVTIQQPSHQIDAPSYAADVPVSGAYDNGIQVSVAPTIRCDFVPTCLFGTSVPSYPAFVPGIGWTCRMGYCDRVHVGAVFHGGYYDTYRHTYVRPYWDSRPTTKITVKQTINYGTPSKWSTDASQVPKVFAPRGPELSRAAAPSKPSEVAVQIQEPSKPSVSGVVQVRADARTSYLRTTGTGNVGVVSNNLTTKVPKPRSYTPQASWRPTTSSKAFVSQAINRTTPSARYIPTSSSRPRK